MALSPAPIQEPVTSSGFMLTQIWVKWLDALRRESGKAPTYAVAVLPAIAPAGSLAFVPDEAGGSVLAFFDGTAWRRSTDRAIVS
jgi:hypothetical protein